MNQVIFNFCLVIFNIGVANSQMIGYTIDREGDTTQVIFKKNQFITGHFNALAFQDNPKYVIGKKKQSVDLKAISELGFEMEGETYVYEVLPSKNGLIIRRLLLKGKVSVYRVLRQSMVSGPTGYGGVEYKYLIRQGVGIPFMPKAIGFKKNLLNNLEPCPKFEEILKGQPFGMRDLMFLMETYNLDCY